MVQGSGFGVWEFMVQGSGFRVQGSGFRIQGSGFRIQSSEFRVQGSGFQAPGSGYRVQSSGLVRVWGCALATSHATTPYTPGMRRSAQAQPCRAPRA